MSDTEDKSINASWILYLKHVIPLDATKKDVAMFKAAFYSGAYGMLLDMADKSNDKYKQLSDEFDKYMSDIDSEVNNGD